MLAQAVLNGNRFWPPLAEALLAAGATVLHTLLRALCNPSVQDRHITLLGKFTRRTLEDFQRTAKNRMIETRYSRAKRSTVNRFPCVNCG
jgi:hypothetical protein